MKENRQLIQFTCLDSEKKGDQGWEFPIIIPHFLSAEGYWDNVCTTIYCDSETTTSKSKTEGTSATQSETKSTEVTKSASAGIEAKGFSMSANYSTTTKNEITNSVTTDISKNVTHTKTNRLAYGPAVRRDMNIASIWQYAIKSTMSGGSTPIVYTRFTACSSDEFEPKSAPGTHESAQTCQGGLVAK